MGLKKLNPFLIKDPSYSDSGNGISAREDLGGGSFHGGIDFKIVDKYSVEKMEIFAYGGPTHDMNENLLPFDFSAVTDYHSDYHHGIPQKWDFKPFFFGKKDFE